MSKLASIDIETGAIIEIDAAPEVEAENEARYEAARNAPPEPPIPALVASGVYTVSDGWVESIGAASGIAMVFPIDVGTYWLFFSEAQPDLSYAAYVSSSQGQINVSARALDYLELCVKDGGTLADPSEFSVNIVRSQ